MKIRINGKEYDWGTIKIIMWGRPVVGATSVDYKLTKAKEALYAAGRYAKGIQHGQRAASGTLTLLQSEIIAMNRAAREKGYKDILDVDVDILISYIPEDSTAITVDQIICASFSELLGHEGGRHEKRACHAVRRSRHRLRHRVEIKQAHGIEPWAV